MGIWRWPFINVLLEVLATRGVRSSIRGGGSLKPTMANVERWEWVDYRGRKRELVIHREIKE